METAEPRKDQVCPCEMFRQVPMAWLICDAERRVVDGNRLFWDEVAAARPSEPGVLLSEALPAGLHTSIGPAVERCLAAREIVELSGVTVFPPSQPSRLIDLRITPARMRDREIVLITSTTVGDAGRRVAELTILHDMVRVLRQERETERVLFTTLTCATAGSGGLGFNRAWVLLVDPTGEWLEGQMALGPSSLQEAHHIWTELTAQPRTLEEFARAYDRWEAKPHHPLTTRARQMRFSMADEAGQLPVLATVEKRAITIKDAGDNPWVGTQLRELLGADEFVVCPMIVKNESCGVIVADNLYSGAPITRAHVRLLSLFAQHAGIAIEDAQLHREMEQALAELSQAQDELVRTEQLAVLGEMSARVAHDLRNPLVTLGGWARVVQEDPNDTSTVAHAANIIAEEAANLEAILSMLLEPFASRNLRLEPTDINQIVRDTLAAQGNKLEQREIRVVEDLAAGLPSVPADPAQLRRCLTNLVDNAANAMATGGVLTVRTTFGDENLAIEIRDTGTGIEVEEKSRIFDAFYSTNPFGSGLGLAVVWDITHAHGFEIGVESEPDSGTAFTIRIPIGAKSSND